ncbi:MAG: hypothetical protein E4H28_07455 [Gemmatimonadales bacterium]|nr:MAG: hypothetical protein E4H28_07455 [Gemmatimonadales bacterium]
MNFSVKELAERVSGRVEGDSTRPVNGLASVVSAGPGQLTYVVGTRYLRFLAESKAAAILVPSDLDVPANGLTLIRVANPEFAFSILLELFHPHRRPAAGVHASAIVGPGVTLGLRTSVGPYAGV